MKRHSWILAGTALALVMTGPFVVTPSVAGNALRIIPNVASADAPIPIAQANETAEQRKKRLLREKRQKELKAKQQAAKAKKPAAADETAAVEGVAPKPKKKAAAVTPAQKRQAAAVAEKAAPKAARKTAVGAAAVPAATQLAQAEETEEERLLRLKREAEEQQQAPAAEEAPAEEAPAPEAAPEPEAPAAEEPARAPESEAPAAEEPEAPAAEEPTAEPEAPAVEEPAAEPEAPAVEEPATEPTTEPEAVLPEPEVPAVDQPATEEAPAGTEAPAEPTVEEAAPPAATEEPADADAPAAVEQPADGDQAPVEGEAPADGEQQGEAQPEGQAPVLDSQKKRPGRGAADTEQAAEPAAPAEPAGPPPADDNAAQATAKPEEVRPVAEEEGTRVEAPAAGERRRTERPEGAEVVREIGDRVIIQFNANLFVESNDRPRIGRGAREVYYEELRNGRVRETVVRKDGTMVVTVRNRYGDIIQRSRILPDGREVVLVYVDERNWDRVIDWRDPGDDLPPMRLTIPVNEYILEADRVEDPDVYYTFLDQPPVEQVERLYSIDEVKRSARIRDKTRRVELDTITFAFGKAEIDDSEVAKLQGVADAMARLLEENPAETFLIEGHTDAVGSNLANLALSDRRAEAVAQALTDVFGLPPENLTTQGYGEEYLKVDTSEPERQNRRVSMRRITALVAPVASAN
jgi:outer membrane protein OmpA-like peptidoglycan-associated protein